ncbi:hypothetical protein SAMN05518863_104361 [Candidatus Pantoea symbiotica]|uniref:Uncharacterized protein n=1 Tax=Candidatus Pantoea symbiotica TaxID=1884370 RepID=A0A1I3WRA7_9GAMM|nr:hypothetical protein SAMN05518863_104361 [Pantoea symbiotica]SFU75075.1 hypothetical protein SAMN05518864_104361 [Pantoea sp. YR525]
MNAHPTKTRRGAIYGDLLTFNLCLKRALHWYKSKIDNIFIINQYK